MSKTFDLLDELFEEGQRPTELSSPSSVVAPPPPVVAPPPAAPPKPPKPPQPQPTITNTDDKYPGVTIPELRSFLDLLQNPEVSNLIGKLEERVKNIKSAIESGVTDSELVKEDLKKFITKYLNSPDFRCYIYYYAYAVDFRAVLTWEITEVYWKRISPDRPSTWKERDVLRKYIQPIIGELDLGLIKKLHEDFLARLEENKLKLSE